MARYSRLADQFQTIEKFLRDRNGTFPSFFHLYANKSQGDLGALKEILWDDQQRKVIEGLPRTNDIGCALFLIENKEL